MTEQLIQWLLKICINDGALRYKFASQNGEVTSSFQLNSRISAVKTNIILI